MRGPASVTARSQPGGQTATAGRRQSDPLEKILPGCGNVYREEPFFRWETCWQAVRGETTASASSARAAHRNCGAGGRAGCTASCLSKCAEDPHNKSEQRFQTSPRNAASLSLLFVHAVGPAVNEAQLAVRLRESRLVRSEAAGRQNEPKTSPLRILRPSCSAHGPNIA